MADTGQRMNTLRMVEIWLSSLARSLRSLELAEKENGTVSDCSTWYSWQKQLRHVKQSNIQMQNLVLSQILHVCTILGSPSAAVLRVLPVLLHPG